MIFISLASLFFFNGVLQIISGVYLGNAVNSIRKFINTGSDQETVNSRQLIQHFLAFGLYLLSTIAVYVFFADYYIFNESL